MFKFKKFQDSETGVRVSGCASVLCIRCVKLRGMNFFALTFALVTGEAARGRQTAVLRR